MAPGNSDQVSLDRLLARGDLVEVECGRLVITSASGRPIPPWWLSKNERQLVTEAARAADVDALEYLGYSVGNYGPSKRGGVTLQFRSLMDGGERYAVFNADTRRERTTKHGQKGAALPRGQFRLGKRSALYRFWLSTGLPFQDLSNLHQRMGNLRGLVYCGSTGDGGRIEVGTLRPLEITEAQLRGITRNSQGSRKELARNSQGTPASKEFPESQQPRRLGPNQSTGNEKYGNTVIREHGYTGIPIPPQDQTNDQWLAEYSDAHGMAH